MNRLALASVLGMGLLVQASVLADFAQGQAAFDRGDFPAALSEWKPLAEQGDAEAQYRIGRMYSHAQGVAMDYALAADWYRRAAAQGHALAQNNLGLMYERGQGVPRDEAEAARWYRLAAEKNRAIAQYNLGRLYETGRGVAQDAAQAAEWFERAARQGHAGARRSLAALDGNEQAATTAGTDADRERSTGNIDDDTGETMVGGPAAADPPVPETSGERAPTGADEWRRRAEEGDAEAQYHLARMYREGNGVPRDPQEMERWYLRAAELGHELALYEIGFLYLRGQVGSGERDFVRAYLWLGRAADRNIGDARQWQERIAPKMSAEEIAEARRLAEEPDNAP